MEASDWNETSELKYLTHWMPLPSPPDDVAAPAEQQAKGLPSGQEPKYTVDGNSVVNRHTGEAIPHDEPIFVFRARDALSVRALEAYLSLIGEREPSSAHAEAVRARIADFRRFANTHQSSMKWPDTATQTVKSEPLQQAAPKAAPGAPTVQGLQHQLKLLAEALGACILASGIVRKDIDGFDGPQLLLFAEDLRSMLEATPQPAPAPLNDAQIAEMMRDIWGCASIAPRHALEFARAVERAHGITQKGGS